MKNWLLFNDNIIDVLNLNKYILIHALTALASGTQIQFPPLGLTVQWEKHSVLSGTCLTPASFSQQT
jgi:hypothetical protein